MIIFINSCTGVVDDNGYLMPNKIDTSDITLDKLLKEDKKLNDGNIYISSIIDARVAKKVNIELKYLNGKVKNINLHIDSRGGWLKDTFDIIDTMHNIATPVNVYVDDLCQSAGVLILISATGTKYAFKDSRIVPHFNRPLNPEVNTQAYFDNIKFESIWRNKTKIPDSWYPLSGNRFINLTPTEALKYGIIDKIVSK